MTQLTKHFSLTEFTVSNTARSLGISNAPNEMQTGNLRRLAETLEVVRTLLGNVPIRVTSGFRSKELNSAVGGVTNSAHLEGLAVDFVAPAYGTPLEIVLLLSRHADLLCYDQLIQEGSWVHLGIFQLPRKQVLTHLGGNNYSAGV